MDKLETEILRGERAKQLLEDPLLKEAFALIELEYMKQWQESPARDVQARETLFLAYKNLEKLRGHLKQVLDSGTLAKVTVAQRAGQTLKRAFS